jgi:hypothetical protein
VEVEMKYFFELLNGSEFTLGGVRCKKLSRRGYEVLATKQQVLIGNERFRVTM